MFLLLFHCSPWRPFPILGYIPLLSIVSPGFKGLEVGLKAVLGFSAVKKNEEWQRVNQTVCRGDDGTLITWVNQGQEHGGTAELCPTGTVPVQGRGYMCLGMVNAYSLSLQSHIKPSWSFILPKLFGRLGLDYFFWLLKK